MERPSVGKVDFFIESNGFFFSYCFLKFSGDIYYFGFCATIKGYINYGI